MFTSPSIILWRQITNGLSDEYNYDRFKSFKTALQVLKGIEAMACWSNNKLIFNSQSKNKLNSSITYSVFIPDRISSKGTGPSDQIFVTKRLDGVYISALVKTKTTSVTPLQYFNLNLRQSALQ